MSTLKFKDFTGKTTNQAVTNAIKSVKATKERLVHASIMVLGHAVEYGNTTPASSLCEQLKEQGGHNTNALREWLEVNGPFTWDNATKSFKLDVKRQKKMASEYKKEGIAKFVAKLEKFPYTDKKEAEYKGFNLKVKIKSILAQAKRISNDPDKASSDLTDLTGIDELDALYKAMDGNDNEQPEVVAETIAA